MPTRLSALLRAPLQGFFADRVGQAGSDGWVALEPRRLFILPTRSGLGYGLLLLVMLLGAVNYNNNLAYALTFLLAGLGLVTMLQCYRNLRGLRLRAGATRAGFAGQQVHFAIELAAPDGQARYAIGLHATDTPAVLTQWPAGETAALWLARTAQRRGHLQLGLVTVETRFPLGLFRTWSRIRLSSAAWVYPRPAPTGRNFPRAPRRLSEAGDQGRGTDDFRGFRRYHPGDSLRHVNWKAVAREQGWLTKEFGGDRVEELWLDWEQLEGLGVEARLQQLCRWVLDADAAQRYFGLRLPDCELAPAQGAAQRERCLRALAAFEASQ